MKKRLLGGVVLLLGLIVLSGCQDLTMFFKGFEESFNGLEMTIQTYDEESQLIDKVVGKSIMIERDSTDEVSLYKTGVPKSTGLLIDGQYLFIYRCDYTIYDLDLLLG